jgi:hypothetical protein
MDWTKFNVPAEVNTLLSESPHVTVASTTEELIAMACGDPTSNYFEVAYDVPGQGSTVEASVTRVRNGLAINYPEPYMRRRDPNCLFIGDTLPTDKETFEHRFGRDFASVRAETLAWLKAQELIIFGFVAGKPGMGVESLAVVPANAGFFALSLAMLQGIIPYNEISPAFAPRAIIYVAPVFRHTHFSGKQVVVHNRLPGWHEMYSFNLYPGPSAKKGVYGMLLELGEQQGWVTAHCSTAQVITPYDNVVVIMHEGASGSGKSEMLEQPHREADGRLLLGENLTTGEKRYLEIPRTCQVRPVTDDMALCHPSLQDGDGRLRLTDAEDAWFVRVNHINNYGTDTNLERLTAKPNTPLMFLNIDAVPGGRSLIWEHTMDAPNKPCPNPRVIIPRHVFPDTVDTPVAVDIRSFGVRTPPCTKEAPTYGIIGLFHLLPPALAWLWRLVSPRGHDNPSIVDTGKMETEGVGAYWPFATGLRVTHANLLLNQFTAYRHTRYILCPNQHIGAWRVGFMPEWVAREYLARRGVARFRPDQLRPARSPLLGYTLRQLHVEGHMITTWFLEVNHQPEVGDEAYDQGAEILQNFFSQYLADFLKADLAPLGKHIIRCCLDRGKLEDYEALIPME